MNGANMNGMVEMAKQAPQAYRFGSKVFLSWLLQNGFTPAQLIAANASGAVRLARADLVEVMDPAIVRASELRYEGATFHFIRAD